MDTDLVQFSPFASRRCSVAKKFLMIIGTGLPICCSSKRPGNRWAGNDNRVFINAIRYLAKAGKTLRLSPCGIAMDTSFLCSS